MSTLRRRSTFDELHRILKKGPTGRNCCRQCGTEVGKWRRTFCSDECVDAWRVLSDPGWVRTLLIKRDHGICAHCGLDTLALEHRFMEYLRIKKLLAWNGPFEFEGRLTPAGRTLWEADHINPVVEGGGECGLEGYRTLCLWCHKTATKELRSRLARKGSRQKVLSL